MRSFQQQDQAMLANLAEATGNHANALYEIDDAEVDSKGLIECALVPLRDLVLFPHMSTPLQIGRERTLATVTAANQRGETLIAVAQLDGDIEDPRVEDPVHNGRRDGRGARVAHAGRQHRCAGAGPPARGAG
ncbi:MAG: DNA-binding ATP-dependent protease La [Chloroflexota bacterium]